MKQWGPAPRREGVARVVNERELDGARRVPPRVERFVLGHLPPRRRRLLVRVQARAARPGLCPRAAVLMRENCHMIYWAITFTFLALKHNETTQMCAGAHAQERGAGSISTAEGRRPRRM